MKIDFHRLFTLFAFERSFLFCNVIFNLQPQRLRLSQANEIAAFAWVDVCRNEPSFSDRKRKCTSTEVFSCTSLDSSSSFFIFVFTFHRSFVRLFVRSFGRSFTRSFVRFFCGATNVCEKALLVIESRQCFGISFVFFSRSKFVFSALMQHERFRCLVALNCFVVKTKQDRTHNQMQSSAKIDSNCISYYTKYEEYFNRKVNNWLCFWCIHLFSSLPKWLLSIFVITECIDRWHT